MSEASEHWLWRLDAEAWLAAAHNELRQGRAQLGARRTAVTHARRAAGMALNGVLVAMATRGWTAERCEQIWGRSYMDHLRALADLAEGDERARGPLDGETCRRCRELLAIPVMPPQGLVQLARGREQAAAQTLALAQGIIDACAAGGVPNYKG